MGINLSLVFFYGGIGVIVVVLVMWVFSPGPVSRVRVERFARRENLLITPGNGNLVIAYLATVRRWRALGLTTGLLLAVAWSLRDSKVTVNVLAGVAGWFAGALVAEFRIAAVRPGARRAASLQPRLLRRQLRPAARWLPLLLVGLVAAETVAALPAAAAGRDVSGPAVLGYALVAALTFGLPVLVGRYVLDRPQPHGLDGDLRAADDALRDRSLHVLAGCAIALTAVPAGHLALVLDGATTSAGIGPLWLLGAVLPVLGLIGGWWVATRSRTPVEAREEIFAS